METFFILMFISVYVISVILSGLYFDKRDFTCKIIYLMAVFMPFWNTYLVIKYFNCDDGSVLDAIRYHFIQDK